MLLLARVVAPEELGRYSWMILALTAFQASSDMAARQVVVSAVTGGHYRFFVIYRRVVSVAGPLVLGTTLLAVTSGDSATLLELLPIVLVPIVSAIGIEPLGRLQAAERWGSLARAQVVAVSIAAVTSIGLAVLFQSLLAGAAHVLVAEVVNVVLVRRLGGSATVDVGVTPSPRGAFFAMSLYSVIAWTQGQADRVLIGFSSGTAVLAFYSVGTALGRSLGDALASGTANVLRGRLRHGMADGEVRQVATSLLLRTQAIAALSCVATISITSLFVRPFLGSTWDPSLDIVNVLAITSFASALAWASGVLHVQLGTAARAPVAPAIGALLAIPVASLALHDLYLAAWAVLVRDVILCTLSFGMIGSRAPWGAWLVGISSTTLFSLLVLIVI